MNENILIAISRTVAQAMNEQNLADIGARLNAVIPASASPRERATALDEAFVYSFAAEQPGYPDDGQPGYLPANANLKEAVLNEIRAMIKADFDRPEHLEVWQSIEKSVADTPEADFAPGIAVNCPDDYLLTLDKISCGDVLRRRNALPAWA